MGQTRIQGCGAQSQDLDMLRQLQAGCCTHLALQLLALQVPWTVSPADAVRRLVKNLISLCRVFGSLVVVSCHSRRTSPKTNEENNHDCLRNNNDGIDDCSYYYCYCLLLLPLNLPLLVLLPLLLSSSSRCHAPTPTLAPTPNSAPLLRQPTWGQTVITACIRATAAKTRHMHSLTRRTYFHVKDTVYSSDMRMIIVTASASHRLPRPCRS